jgi:serine/threonine protein kinase
MIDALDPGTRLGPYEIEELIASGGMGRVYRAHDARLSRSVAIKTLAGTTAEDPELARRFESEVRTIGSLDHPNLLVVHDVGRIGDVPYLVSELLHGETLRERLRRQGALAERLVVDLARQMTSGLEAAHSQGVVHRDLKPENLFLTSDRRLKILDFGIAKHVKIPGAGAKTSDGETLTVTGSIVGTVGYMAPEQALGEPIDARSDIFAVGIVMHEMLSGHAPFRRESTVATLNAIVSTDPPELPATVSPLLSQIVGRCIMKSPADRFQNAHDLALALDLLEQTSRSGATNAAASSAIHKPAPMSRRRAVSYGAASLLLLTTGALAGSVAGPLIRGRSSVTPTFRRLTFRRGLIRSARLAPDGQTILYGALWDGEQCRVHTARIDGPESSPLNLPDASVLAISSTGEVALALGPQRLGTITYGTLARVPMAGGVPRELTPDVKFADWSPDGSALALIRGVAGRDRLEYPLGTPLFEPAEGEHTGLGFARVSPDGDRVAFIQYLDPGSLRGRVAMIDRGKRLTVLSEDYANIHGLAWHGNEIWFSAAEDRPLFRAICAVAPGSAVRAVARAPGNVTLWDAVPDGRLLVAHTDDRSVMVARRPNDVHDRDLSWLDASLVADISRDGQLILFTEIGQGGGPNNGAYLRGSDGSPAVRLADGKAYALSPDSRWALCGASTVTSNAPSPHLELVPTGAGVARRVAVPGLSFHGAKWLADDNHVIVSASETGRRARLFRLDLRDNKAVPVAPEGIGSWVVAPDGAAIAARAPDGRIRIYPTDGSSARELPGLQGFEIAIGWIHAGVLITRNDGKPSSIGAVHLVNPATGSESEWANVLPQDPAGIMGLTSFRVTPDGRSRAYTWHRALSSLYLAEGIT